MVTVVLIGLIGRICVSYFDDTAVYSDDHAQHLHHLREVFERVQRYNLTLNGEKCQIAVSKVNFWGHVIDADGYNHLPERQQQAFSFPRPNTPKQMERFTGLATYFSFHIKDFARIRRRLIAAIVDKKIVYTDDSIAAFEEMKQKMVASVKLYFPDYALQFHLVVDASKSGIGGYLHQLRESVEEPLVFISLAFSAVQSRWAVEEQEAFAVYFGVMHSAWILRGVHFMIHTDHKNLTYIREHASPKVVRWNLRLQEFDFSVVHLKGTDNITDGFSRSHQVDQAEQVCELSLADVPQSLHPQPKTIECPTVDTSKIEADHLKAIIAAHEASLSGHRGVSATLRTLRQLRVQWPSMRQDIVTYVHACPICQKTWLHQRLPQYTPATIEVYEPFSVLASDWIGPLPEDRFGNKYMHSLIDHGSRYAYLFAHDGPSAANTAQDLVQLFAHHDICNTLLSDNGAAYIAYVQDEYCRLLRIDHRFTTPYRSQQNAVVERNNGSILNHMQALIQTDQEITTHWSECIPLITRLLNTSFHSVLQCTPSAIVFGTHHSASRILFKGSTPPQKRSLREHYNKMLAMQSRLLKQSEIFQAKHSDDYVLKTAPVPTSDQFAIGSLVLVTYPSRAPSKLHPRLRGPFKILESFSDDVYMCQNFVNGHSLEFHISQLRPYTTDISPDALTPLEVASRDHEEFAVDSILDHRVKPRGHIKKRSTLEFLVAWLGYGEEYHSWEPYANVKDLTALQDYVEITTELAYLV